MSKDKQPKPTRRERMIAGYLKSKGCDFNDPSGSVKRAIKSLIDTSIPSFFSKEEMIKFLESEVERIENEY